jgi:DNA-binding response OmpR family regulator
MLLVEPDDAIANDLLTPARLRSIDALRCRDGAEALVGLGTHVPEVLVIAASTPVLSAERVIEVGRRHHDLYVVVGAGRGDVGPAADALAAGATAIVARPYDLNALLAMSRGLRSHRAAAAAPETLVFGGLTVNLRAYEARLGDAEVLLTVRELDVLAYLLRRRGEVASREEISDAVWGRPVDTNTVAVHIKRLRDKLGEHASAHGPVIHTIRGAGYRLLSTADESCPDPTDAAV